jgi:hypothetical protein
MDSSLDHLRVGTSLESQRTIASLNWPHACRILLHVPLSQPTQTIFATFTHAVLKPV